MKKKNDSKNLNNNRSKMIKEEEEVDTLAMYRAYKKAKKEGKLITVESLSELI